MRSLLLAATLLASVSSLAAAPAFAATEATQPAIPAEAGPIPTGKLTDAITPSAYRLNLTVDPSQERFSGHAEIDAALKAPSRTIWLHGRDLKVSKAAAIVGGKSYPASYAEVDPTGVALLTFAEPLQAGPVTLSFEYDAPFGDSASGLYRVKVGDDWYAWTQFQSIDARATFPSFDEPGFKTPFAVTLTTPKGLMAVANTNTTGTAPVGDMVAHSFAPTLPLPTYLVAMVVGPFAVAESVVAPTAQRSEPLPLRMVATQPNAGKLDYGLQGSKRIVELLESYFNEGFPFPKLDQIASPVMPGAMENAGADIYADPLIVLDAKSPPAQKRDFGMVVAHELAHQWFGDLVTPAWWDDIWLNESFANWMGFRIGGEWDPSLDIGAGALAEGFAAMKLDALTAGRPIHQPIEQSAAIDSAFDAITYGKGGHVIAMIAGFMGDDKFRNGVRRYMAAHRYGSATTEDFFAALGEAAGDPRITPAMLSFIDQQGVPLVTFAPGKKGAWSVTQSRYAQVDVTAPATAWKIPVCARQAAARECVLLDGFEHDHQAGCQGSGDAQCGGHRILPVRHAYQPVGRTDRDRRHAQRGRGDGAVRQPDRQFRRRTRDTAATDRRRREARCQSRSLRPRGGARRDRGLPRQRHARRSSDQGGARLHRRSQRQAADGAGLRSARRSLCERGPRRAVGSSFAGRLLAGPARDTAVNATLTKAARAYLGGGVDGKGDRGALDAAFMGPAFAALVREGGAEAARQLGEAALASQDPVFRPTALGAIGSSGDLALADWLLNQWKDERLRPIERFSVIAAVIGTPETRQFGYDWLKANYEGLAKGGGLFMAQRVPGLLGGFCSADMADRIQADFGAMVGESRGKLSLARTIERTRNCGLLKEARGAEVNAAFAGLK